MQFAKANGRIPKIIHKKAADMTLEEKEEKSLYNKWVKTEEKKIVDELLEKYKDVVFESMETRGLCSYYAERNGLMIGYEVNEEK